MIGDTYKSAAVQAVLGDAHSPVIPDVLWGAWLDDTLTLLAMTGTSVPHEVFGGAGDGVENTETIDGGLCPATVPDFFALCDAASGGNVIAYCPVTFETTPAEGDPLSCAPGLLLFPYAGA